MTPRPPNEPYVFLSQQGKVQFSVLSGRVRRLDGRYKLLSRQMELMLAVLLDYITTERTRSMIEQIENLQTIAGRHEDDAD